MSRLKDTYTNEIVDAMTKKFGYKNVMEVPKLEKIVVNIGCGEARENIKVLEEQIDRLEEEKTKLSNTSVMEFKFMVDQLQETWFKIGDLLAKQDDEAKAKMSAALHKVVEDWIHEA